MDIDFIKISNNIVHSYQKLYNVCLTLLRSKNFTIDYYSRNAAEKSSSIANEPSTGLSGKQTSVATMAAKGIEPARDPPLPEEESDHKILLDILPNQKAAEEKQDKRHNNLDKSIAASKLCLDKHIEENDKALPSKVTF